MARYLGATCRISRRYSLDLDFKTRDLESKCRLASPPGMHGQRRKRETEYGTQLAAKQALRMKYGLLEKQFRNLYKKADRLKGATGVILLQLLESRLDNLVFRMGFACTRREARQLVCHKGIIVNGICVNIPSYRVYAGDVVSVRERAKSQGRVQESLKSSEDNGTAEWLEIDVKAMSGTYKRVPEREDLPSDINEQLIVELYSK